MKTWGYASGSLCVVLGLMSLVIAILFIVVTKASVSDATKSNMVGFAAFVLVLAVATMIIGAVTIWHIYLANMIYLKVSAEAAQGEIVIAKPSTNPVIIQPQIQSPPPAPIPPSTTTDQQQKSKQSVITDQVEFD